MAVKIRLTRKGKKKQPTYRVVVADGRSPRDGRFIEQIGRYDPRQEPSIVEINNERASYWLSVGAQPSSAVRKLFEISGALEARPAKTKSPKVHVVEAAVQVAEAATKDPKVHVVEEAAQVVDAQDDESIIEAAAEVAASIGDAAPAEAAELAGEIAASDDEIAVDGEAEAVTEAAAEEEPS